MKRKPGCHTKTSRETSHAYDTIAITTKGERGDGGQEKRKQYIRYSFAVNPLSEDT
jgi:hypothetical protein